MNKVDVYYFYVAGDAAREYLKGTNFVSVWDQSSYEAFRNVQRYFTKETYIKRLNQKPENATIGYLY